MCKLLQICGVSLLLATSHTILSAPVPAYHNYGQYSLLFDWQGKSSAQSADADKDGLSNFQEYALGYHPLNPDSGAAIYRIDTYSDTVKITYRRNPSALDAYQLIEKSDNQVDWQPVSIKTDTITFHALPDTYIQQAVVKLPKKAEHYRVSILPLRVITPSTQSFQLSVFESKIATSGIGIKLTANPWDHLINPQWILDALQPYGRKHLHLVLEGHFRIGNNLRLENYDHLTITGLPHTYLEQTNAFNDAAPINLHNCQNVTIADIKLGGAGKPRNDGKAPSQNGIRVIGSKNITIRDCQIQSATGTMKIAINLIDSTCVTIKNCRFRNVSHACVISGTGIWPHPTNPSHFSQPSDLRCSQIEVTDCEFESVSVGIAFDDETQGAVARNNQFRNHYGHAIIAEDGSTNIVIENNRSYHGRGALAVAGTGQTRKLAVPITISNNVATNANDPTVIAPSPYFSNTPVPSAFHNTNHPGVTLKNNREIHRRQKFK